MRFGTIASGYQIGAVRPMTVRPNWGLLHLTQLILSEGFPRIAVTIVSRSGSRYCAAHKVKDTTPNSNLKAPLFSDQLHIAIGRWMPRLDDLVGWRDFKHKAMAKTLFYDDFMPPQGPDGDYKFPPDIALQHDVLMSYYALAECSNALRDVEYYFRRYPFRGLPVSHHEHLRYICEMYFSRFYQFEERLKVCLNAINASTPSAKIEVGRVIKQFSKEFFQEIRERSRIHHVSQFEDIDIDRIMVTGSMANDPNRGPIFARQQREYYRKATKEWAERAKRMGARVNSYVEGVAELIITVCKFLPADTTG